MSCPICGKSLKTWYAMGGRKIIGCSDIICNYQQKNDG